MPRNSKYAKKFVTLASESPQISQSLAQKYLAKVPEENIFWCNNGTVIRDLKELKESLAGMSDQTFAYHSNAIKKDFSNWIKYVIGDEQLAADLENATNREKAAQVIEARHRFLVSKAGY